VNHPPDEPRDAVADWLAVLMLIEADAGEEPVINTLGVEPKEHVAS
jgi:hypothetical protein